MSDRILQLKVLLSKPEKRWLQRISALQGLTVSDAIRLYIRSEYDRMVAQGTIFEKRAKR